MSKYSIFRLSITILTVFPFGDNLVSYPITKFLGHVVVPTILLFTFCVISVTGDVFLNLRGYMDTRGYRVKSIPEIH